MDIFRSLSATLLALLHWSDISPNRDLVTELDLISVFDVITLFPEVSIRHLQRVRLVKRECLLLGTPGTVPFGTCICSNVETILSWACNVDRPSELRTSLGASILLINVIKSMIYNAILQWSYRQSGLNWAVVRCLVLVKEVVSTEWCPNRQH